jgi:hypothetical protein
MIEEEELRTYTQIKKDMQKRYTLEDVKKKQKDLREYLQGKVKSPDVIEKDRLILPDLMTDALLSQPYISRLHPTIEFEGIIGLADNLFELLSLILDPTTAFWKNGKGETFIKITHSSLSNRPRYVKLSKIWIIILNCTNRLSSGAQSEAISRSKERESTHGMSEESL